MKTMLRNKFIQPYLITVMVLLPAVVCSFELLDYALIPRYLLLCVFSFWYCWVEFKDHHANSKGTVLITPIRILTGVWFCACMVSVVNTNLYGEYLFEVFRVGLYLIFFLLLTRILRADFSVDWFLRTVAMLTIVLCLISGWQFFHFKAVVTMRGMEPVTGLMSNKNLLAEYLAILFPFITYSFATQRGVWKFLSAVAIFLSVSFLMVLLGRAAWMGLIIAGLFVLVFVWIGKKESVIKYKKVVLTFGLWSALLIGAVVLMASYFDVSVFLNRFLSIFNVNEGSAGGRLEVWRLTWTLIKEEPWFGLGLGRWKIVFQQFGFSRQPVFLAEPLNDYIGMFAEAGVFGFLGYSGMLLSALAQLIRMALSKRPNGRFHLVIASSLVVFAVVSFFNFPIHRIEHSVLMLFALAVADSSSPSINVRIGKWLGLLGLVVLLIFSLAASYTGIVRYASEKYARLALEARSKNDWPRVITNCDKVCTHIYPMEPSTTPILWYRGVAHFSMGNVDNALTDFREAMSINPYHVHVINNLATSYALSGDLNRAIELYREAIRKDKAFVDAVVNLIAIYEHRGDYEEIQDILKNSFLKHSPELVEIKLRLRKAGKINI